MRSSPRFASLLVLIACATVVALATASCAHPSLKTNAIVSLQATMAATGTAQDFEIAAYNAKSLPALTDQAHLAISQAFVTVFDVQGKAALAVDAWRAGDPVPADLATYVKDLSDALGVAKEVAPGAAQVIDKIQAAVTTANAVVAVIRGEMAR